MEILKHKSHNNSFSVEDKYNSVLEVVKGKSTYQVSIELGISEGNIQNWINNYKIYGYNGLVNKKKGRKSKNTTMKKTNIHKPKKLNESEREELIRLRAENEYIKAENEYIKAENEIIKKEIALREKNYAAQLKAKKQRLSKNSKKKATD
ncbi:helix-turn-helix domain-containing protein [Anaerococcus sp. WCA-380-WT-2B]|uniref:Helix-turn-helix domain-containing protein n=1 Tax=Anaerococcus porci TaxID=2652269 RepID=A0A6N7VRY2_9FIRM|nr:helix-turn-helix domain-containing protein [Anaerococcus porci]